MLKERKKKGESLNLHPLWKVISDDYDFQKILGSGTFGDVIKGRHKMTKTHVAIKLLKNSMQDEYQAKKVLTEI